MQSEAERIAGYGERYGNKLLRDPRVLQRLDEIREEVAKPHKITLDAIVDRLLRIATLDPLEAYDFALAVETITIKHGEDGIDIEQVRPELRNIPKEVRQLMDISFTAKGIVIKFPDKQRALENIARLTGVGAPEKVQLNVPLIAAVNIIQEG
jgi:hypothetical protein